MDELLPDVLVFPAGTDLHDHHMVQAGVLILQVSHPSMMTKADFIATALCVELLRSMLHP